MKMFKFLKEKLKQAVSQFADDIEEKGEEETQEEIQEEALEPSLVEKKPPEEPKEEKGFFKRIKEKITGESELEQVPEEELEEIKPGDFEESKEEIKEPEVKEEEKQKAEETVKEKLEKKETPSAHELAERKPEVKEKLKEITPKVEEEPKKEKSFFGKLKEKIVTKKINETQFDDLFWNLEVILLENNVAVEVIEKIKQDLKTTLVDKPIPRGAIEKTIKDSLKNSLESLFTTEKIKKAIGNMLCRHKRLWKNNNHSKNDQTLPKEWINMCFGGSRHLQGSCNRSVAAACRQLGSKTHQA